MKRFVAALVAVLALALPATSSALSSWEQYTLESAVVHRINTVRANHGLRRLRGNARLRDAAKTHNAVMASHGYCAHDWWDGTPISTWIWWFWPGPGYTYAAAGENLYWSSSRPTARQVVRWWMHSPPHRANVLGRWRRIAVSAIRIRNPIGDFSRYSAITTVTVEFGRRS
jgi:uncharacterized protein YkwD